MAFHAAPCCARGVGLAGAVTLPGGMVMAADEPPIGTHLRLRRAPPSPSARRVPRTGAYAVQGEDELKGMQLAVAHINGSHDLMKMIAPKVSKGVLDKQVNLVVADLAAKPNDAVQEQQTFISENKIIAMTGSTSSVVAVVAGTSSLSARKNFVPGTISGSNDTTGKVTAPATLPPVLLCEVGGERHRPGPGQGVRQGQEGGVHDAGLHLRPHCHEVGE